MRRRAIAAVVLAGCGARTGLLEGAAGDGGVEEGDAALDAAPARDASVDAGPDAPPARCRTNADCDDGVACTVDRCDVAAGTCSNAPDDSLCSPGFVCQPPCVATSFAESADILYGVDLPSGAVTAIGSTRDVPLDDIALAPDGTLYGVQAGAPSEIYVVDPMTGAPTPKVAVAASAGRLNALDFSEDGTLYGAAGDGSEVFRIDLPTGSATKVAAYPDSYVSSGDLAIVGNRLLATIYSTAMGGSDALVSIDLTTFEATLLGPTGYEDVYGLAAYGDQLFGYTSVGQVLQIDPETGRATLLASTGIAFFGASAR